MEVVSRVGSCEMFRGLEFGVGSLERGSRSGARQCLDLELRNVEAEVFGGSGNRKLFHVESWEFWELGVVKCSVVGSWKLEVGSLEKGSRSGARQCLDLELRNVDAEVFGGSGNRKLFQELGVVKCSVVWSLELEVWKEVRGRVLGNV